MIITLHPSMGFVPTQHFEYFNNLGIGILDIQTFKSRGLCYKTDHNNVGDNIANSVFPLKLGQFFLRFFARERNNLKNAAIISGRNAWINWLFVILFKAS